jgi:hypothetical protein
MQAPPMQEYDQVVKGNVTIKKISKHNYRITFRKIGKFLVYQVWDKDNFVNQNSYRSVYYTSAKSWVNLFNSKNKDLKQKKKPLFTPTTVIEIDDQDDNYVFVIHEAYLNSHGKVVFTVSTKEIKLESSNTSSKNLIKIPCGKFNNVRFDIDAVASVTSPSPSSVTIFEYNIQPQLNNKPVETFSWGQVVFTLDRSFPNFSYTATTTFIPLSFNSTLKTNLTKVTIGNSVTSIGDRAFLECYALTSVTIPDSVTSIVTSIGKNAFSTCRGLTSLKIGNSVTSIGDSAFSQCFALRSVTIPNSVTSIGNNAFYGCALTSVTIPDSVTSIGNLTFYGCGELVTVIIGKSVTSIGQAVFAECKSLKVVTIGKSVTIIGVSAFSGCSALTTITIPDSAVTSISNYAFYKCYGLTSIQIPDSVTSIAQLAFDQSGLTSVNMTQKTANTLNISTTSGPVSFFGTDNNVSITIIPPPPPPSVTIFEYNIQPQLNNQPVETFSWGQVVFTLDRSFPNFSYTATTITFIPMPSQSFNSPIKANLTKVTVGNSVTSIGDSAFIICTGLTSVTIPDSVTSIGNNAFYGCDALTSITIPDSVRSIGDYAFYQCTGLISLEIDDAYTSIGNSAFFICSALRNVDLGNSVTSIGDNAFSRCSALTSITIPDLVTSIGVSAFSQCFALRSVKIGVSVTRIRNNAFYSNNITYNTSTNQFEGLDAVLKSVKMTQKTANTLDISTTSGPVSFFGSGFAYGRNAAPATLKVTSIIIIP